MVKRLLRLIVATGSFALIALVSQAPPAQGQHPCYACISQCGDEQWEQHACDEFCGGAEAQGCFSDIYGYCSGTSEIVQCGLN